MHKIALATVFVMGFARVVFGDVEANFQQSVREFAGIDVEIQAKESGLVFGLPLIFELE